ncbi:G-type lectin S-receptor-like serine/threonine-protein kinase [Tanacetum coccineum]
MEVVLISLISTWLLFAYKRRKLVRQMGGGGLLHDSKNQVKAIELPLSSFSTIVAATSSFSPYNILGSGGFVSVYKLLAASSGYMSLEYASNGVFSIKSGVFSFGVLVLEIVTGKRNRNFIQAKSENNLIGYDWVCFRPMTAKLGPGAQVIVWSKPGGLVYLLYVIKSPQSSMILPADHVLRAVINARLPVPLLLLVCFWSYLFHAVMLPYQVGDVPLTWSAAVLLSSG